MARSATLLILFSLLAIRPALALPALGPPEAATRTGATVTVEFVVRGFGLSSPRGFHELYSQPTWDAPGTFFVRVPDAQVTALKRLGIRDFEAHLGHHRIRATGLVQALTLGSQALHPPCITLATLDALEVLPPRYELLTIEGFTLHVHPDLAQHPREWAEEQAEVRTQLAQIRAVVTPTRLAHLQTVPIRVEWARTPHAANYTWQDGKTWDDDDPEACDAIVLNHAAHVVEWSRQGQPWMLLHELAHALHHRFLGGDAHPGIQQAFRHAQERHLYDQVAYVHGGTRPAYASTDAREYFAELSEAYLGRNDYFPFTRTDLQQHDPEGYAVLRKVWDAPP